MYNFTCTPRIITSYLLSIAGLLITANFLVIHRRIVAPDPVLRGFRAAFYLGGEANFPSLFTALLMISCGIILWKLASNTTSFKVLSACCLFIAGNDFFDMGRQLLQLGHELLPPSVNTNLIDNYLITGTAIFVATVAFICGLIAFQGKFKLRYIITFFGYIAGYVIKTALASSHPVEQEFFDAFIPLGLSAGQILKMGGTLFLFHNLLHLYISNIKRADITLTFFPSNYETLKNVS